MGIALSSLRVSAEFDASAYVRGAAQKSDADARMIAADKARNASLAQVDAAMARAIPGMATLSKSLLDGYGAGTQFEAIVRRIGNAVDRGMGLDRANVLLEAAYRKFGLTADAAVLAERGFVSIVPAVRELNTALAAYEERARRAELVTRAFAQAKTLLATQAANQAGFNELLGVGRSSAGTAKASADSFLADFGGVDGVERAKAQQISKNFTDELNSRLVPGIKATARESAAAFNQMFDQMEAISQVRVKEWVAHTVNAVPAGNLADQINARLGIGGSRRSAGESADFFVEQAGGVATYAKAQRDAAVAEEQAAAKAAALRAQIRPLEAEMVKLGKEMAEYRRLLNAGVISSHEFEQAQVMAAKRLSDVDMNMRKAATGGRVLSGEMANLGYQVNDVLTGIMLGQSPFMIMAQQGGQIYQIFSHSKASVGDFVSTAIGGLRNFLTVGRLAFGGVVAATAAAIFALNDYLTAQQKVQMGLLGSGRASGATVGGIKAIAEGAATPAGLSVSEARNLATALATTGKVANDNILPIVKMGKDISHIFGIEAPEAAKMLAESFSDPARGAESLNARLGFLDAAMQRQISNLVAQNRTWEAQRVLTTAATSSLEQVSGAVAKSTKFWTALGNAISNAWDTTGEFVAGQLNLQNFDAAGKIDEATAALGRLRAMRANMVARDRSTTSIDQAIDREIQKRDAATASLERYSRATTDAQQRQQSLAQAAGVRAEQPQIDAVERLTNAQELLIKTMIDVQTTGGPASEILKRMGVTYEQLAASLNVATNNLKSFKTEFESQSQSLSIANQAITSFSPSAKGEIARQQSLQGTNNSKLTDTERRLLAEQAYTNAVKQSLTALSESARQRTLAANQNVASTALDIEMFGKTLGQQTEMRANLQARQALEQQLLQQHGQWGPVQDAEIERLKKINAEFGKQTDLAARAAINDNIRFGAQTSMLSQEDVSIAQQLRGIYPDVATGLASVEATVIRTNTAISGLSSTLSGSLATGFTDIADGTKSIGQGATDMKNLVIRALSEMLIKIMIITPAMRALQMAASSFGLIGGGGGAAGGAMSTGAAGIGGIGGLYADGGAFGSSNVIPFARGGAFTNMMVNSPTFFRFANGGSMATGVMGEAGPEAVMPLRRGPDGKLGVASPGGGGQITSLSVNFHNAPAGTQAGSANLRSDGRGGMSLDIAFKNAVAEAVTSDASKNGPMSKALMARSQGFRGR